MRIATDVCAVLAMTVVDRQMQQLLTIVSFRGLNEVKDVEICSPWADIRFGCMREDAT